MKRSFADIMAGLDSERAQKVARKLPAWAAVDADRRAAGLDPLEFPSALSLEQCSSSATAAYKANLAVSVPASWLVLQPPAPPSRGICPCRAAS